MSAPGRNPDLPFDDRGPMLVGVSWGLTALASAFLVLRIYCKLKTGRGLWWDDWTLIAAWCTIIANDAITTVLVNDFKLGRHDWDLEIYDPVRFTLVLSSRATVTITAVVWTKTAFAITLLRLTKGMTKAFVWFIIISMNIAMGFSAMVPWIQCTPLTKGWISSLPGTCWAPRVGSKIWIATGAYSAAMDFTLAALPWTFLFTLSMKTKEKIGVAVALSMGVVAGVVAIIKCVNLPNLGEQDAYYDVILFLWDVAESTVTMMAACIPTLRVLLRETKSRSQPSQLSDVPDLSKLSYQGLGVKNPNLAHELKMLSTQDTSRVSAESGRQGEPDVRDM